MTYLQAILLGLLQGIAEIVPISRSGQVRLFEKLLGLPNVETDYIFFDMLLHLAALCAVLFVYRRTVAALTREALTMARVRTPRRGESADGPRRRTVVLLLASVLPMALLAALSGVFQRMGDSSLAVGAMLILLGFAMYLCEHLPRGKKTEREMTLWDALVMGFAQMLAAIPGLSRPGLTLTVGAARGLERGFALQFSFLMSIPVLFGSVIIKLIAAIRAGIDSALLLRFFVGALVAAASGVGALRLLQYLAGKGRYSAFAYYCWGAGIISMFLFLIS